LTTKIYHNPACSKSRQTLKLLNEFASTAGSNTEIIEYLNNPPTKQQLKDILSLLSLSPRQLMRDNEKVYNELNLQNPELLDDDLLDAMITNPILIQRPIVIANGKAVIGRPPERVIDTLFGNIEPGKIQPGKNS